MSDKVELPRYRCHKIVRAAKIMGVSGPPGEPAKLTLWLETDSGGEFPLDVDPSYAGRMPQRGDPGEQHPAIGGYYVCYEDGHESWSPAKAFEEGYARLGPEHGSAEAAVRALFQGDVAQATAALEAFFATFERRIREANPR